MEAVELATHTAQFQSYPTPQPQWILYSLFSKLSRETDLRAAETSLGSLFDWKTQLEAHTECVPNIMECAPSGRFKIRSEIPLNQTFSYVVKTKGEYQESEWSVTSSVHRHKNTASSCKDTYPPATVKSVREELGHMFEEVRARSGDLTAEAGGPTEYFNECKWDRGDRLELKVYWTQ